MKEKYSQFTEEKNLLHGTILCQTEKKKPVCMLYICQDREDRTCPYIWDTAVIMGIFLQVEYMFA